MAATMTFSPEPPKSGILKQSTPDSEMQGIPEELMPNRSPNKKVHCCIALLLLFRLFHRTPFKLLIMKTAMQKMKKMIFPNLRIFIICLE